MEKNIFAKLIANALQLQEKAVANTLSLLEEGCTIPFISRYRKERTGGLDEVQIAAISDRFDKLKEIEKRKETVIKTITDLEKMTPELQQRIDACWDATELEDIYLPYRPKRRTRAQVAREQGLEPLAKILLLCKQKEEQMILRKYHQVVGNLRLQFLMTEESVISKQVNGRLLVGNTHLIHGFMETVVVLQVVVLVVVYGCLHGFPRGLLGIQIQIHHIIHLRAKPVMMKMTTIMIPPRIFATLSIMAFAFLTTKTRMMGHTH